jgi:hypothetical protein
MQIKITLVNDYKIPSEVMKGKSSKSIWISDAEVIYDKLLEILENEVKDLDFKELENVEKKK